MKHLSLLSLWFFFAFSSMAQAGAFKGLYINTFGEAQNPALIFVHGGPGYDSQDFEWTTAANLAKEGYFVIVYDQRGQGRSEAAQSPQDYTYARYARDLKEIIDHLKLVKPTLLAHSHGGPISLEFDKAFPGNVGKIILMGAPVNFWKSMEGIQTHCSVRYTARGQTAELARLETGFATLNKPEVTIDEEIVAVADIFALGGGCGLYSPSLPTLEARELRRTLAERRVSVSQDNLYYPMPNFLIYEKYIRIDRSEFVRSNADRIFAIYGEEDGLFTPADLTEIEASLVANAHPHRFQLIKAASHSMYIDQQSEFFAALQRALKPIDVPVE